METKEIRLEENRSSQTGGEPQICGVKRSFFACNAVIHAILVAIIIALGVEVWGNSEQNSSKSDVTSLSENDSPTGQIRKYYIQAEEVLWDFAPLNKNMIKNQDFAQDDVFTSKKNGNLGKQYYKVIYVEYTDDTFQTKKTGNEQAKKHLGLLGPVIRAQVGDTIEIYFQNNAQIPATMHAHGVFYGKDSEGAPYNDHTSGHLKVETQKEDGHTGHGPHIRRNIAVGTDFQADDAVLKGNVHQYIWKANKHAGPNQEQTGAESQLWMYHSHYDEIQDANTGLMGPIVIYEPGTLDPNTGLPRDIDREFFLMFMIIDENLSMLYEKNLKQFGSQDTLKQEFAASVQEGNQKHGINGRIYGNLQGLDMKVGQTVKWYLVGMGGEMDLHTVHWHGQTVLDHNYENQDVIQLLPMAMKTATMIPDNPGTWQLHCHVDVHIGEGMIALYTISDQ